VSVCVAVLSDPRRAVRCLDSLMATIGRDPFEVVVIANGLPAADREALEVRDDIVLVRSGTNLGFAGGNNLAAEVASGHHLLFLNDDSVIEEGCIERLLSTAERDRSIGAVGSRILSGDGSVQEAGSVLWSDGWATHVGLGLPGDTSRFAYVRDVDYASANGLLVRKTAWDALGGFDPQYYPAYFEDADLCMGLRRHGYRVVYEPRARLRHLEGQSTSWRYRNFLLRRNRERFVAKWASELADLDDRPAAPDEAAIERSIHRARGSPPRVLVVSEFGGSDADAALGDVVEQLARQGWAVTMVRTPERSQPGASVDPAQTERMADLGIDVRDDADGALVAVGADFEVLVGATGSERRGRAMIRPDGTEVPVVRVSPRIGDSGVSSAVRDVTGAARRTPAHQGTRS
jgi:GT2 family glycosyltransferase